MDQDEDTAFVDIPLRVHLAPAQDSRGTPHKSVSATANPIASQHSQHTHSTSASQKLRADKYREMSERNVRDHVLQVGVDSWCNCALDTPDDPRWSKAAAVKVCQELIQTGKIQTRKPPKENEPGSQLYTHRKSGQPCMAAGWSEWRKALKKTKENDKYSHISPMSEQICEAAQSVNSTLYSDKRRALFKNTPYTGIEGVQVDVPDLMPDGQLLLAESTLNALLKEHGTARKGRSCCSGPKIPSSKTRPCGGIFEFKLKPSDSPQNDRQILGGATLLLHNDPNRRFVLGITIEGTIVRIWRFDRGLILVSSSFAFEKEPEQFIRIMLYFSYADEVQLGFDPTVRPVSSPGQALNDFVYEINGRSFRTVGNPLSEDNASLIISRGVRVWKVRECDKNGKELKGKVPEEGVMKEMWLYRDALSEQEIQTNISARLEDLDKKGPVLGEEPRAQRMKKFFLEITECERVTINGTVDMTVVKPVDAKQIVFPCVGVNDEDDDDMLPDPSNANRSHPSSRRSARALPGSKSESRPGFVTLQHHNHVHWRYLVKEECQTMYDLADLKVALSIGSDLAVALDLLRQAGYMHRDISGGNCMVYRNPITGAHEAKLADLEFCKTFESTTCHDPVTGTFEFMPVECRLRNLRFVFLGDASPKFHWHPYHDLESLYWVVVWYIFSYFPHPYDTLIRPTKEQWDDWTVEKTRYFSSADSTFDRRFELLLKPGSFLVELLQSWGWDKDVTTALSDVLSLGRTIATAYNKLQTTPQNPDSKWPIELFTGDIYRDFSERLANASRALKSGKVEVMNKLNPDLKRKRDEEDARAVKSGPCKRGKRTATTTT